jgi:hypothetical protein
MTLMSRAAHIAAAQRRLDLAEHERDSVEHVDQSKRILTLEMADVDATIAQAHLMMADAMDRYVVSHPVPAT